VSEALSHPRGADAHTPPAADSLQHVHASTPLARVLGALYLSAAVVLLLTAGWRLWQAWTLGPWIALALIAGAWLLADFLSGIVHWAADTWGRVDTAWIGPRFLQPFRVHHVNPRDILDRHFVDLNGDVALLTLPLLAVAAGMPFEHGIGQFTALSLAATAGWVLPTNQIHQWAHQATPPRLVQTLQASGCVLSRRAHAVHHANPAGGHYCITTGWCNAPLARIGFHRRIEQLVTWSTGLQPRVEDIDALLPTSSPRGRASSP
jgi:ubiquitin-conjugating enzyme E2 variant